MDVCRKRNDIHGETVVMLRLQGATSDLHAADARFILFICVILETEILLIICNVIFFRMIYKFLCSPNGIVFLIPKFWTSVLEIHLKGSLQISFI